jgi:uncharacterized SAM-binding protein YcdF (DUF218 family)
MKAKAITSGAASQASSFQHGGDCVKRIRQRNVFLLGLAMVVGCSYSALRLSPELLFVQSENRQAEAIVALGGDVGDRSWRTLDLMRSGHYRIILITGTPWETAFIKRRLLLAGVQESVIVTETRAKSTLENATFALAMLRQRDITNAVLVTSWCHSRRAFATFQHFGEGIQIASTPAVPADALPIRPGLDEMLPVAREYLKLMYYWVRYGISPFGSTRKPTPQD